MRTILKTALCALGAVLLLAMPAKGQRLIDRQTAMQGGYGQTTQSQLLRQAKAQYPALVMSGDELPPAGAGLPMVRQSSPATGDWTLGDGTTLLGAVIGGNGVDYQQYGVYSFTASQNMLFNFLTPGKGITVRGAGYFSEGVLHYVDFVFLQRTEYQVVAYSHFNEVAVGSWASLTSQDIPYQFAPVSCAWDPVTRKTYGVFYNSDITGYEFCRIDYQSMERQALQTMTQADIYLGVAINGKGEMYGIRQNGQLYRIDKNTGKGTRVGNRLGFMPYFSTQPMAFDNTTGRLYWAGRVNGIGNALYEINTKSAKATRINFFPANQLLTALGVPEYEMSGDVPAKVDDLAANFSNGSLTGTVTFTMPTQSFGGTALSGDVRYYLATGADTLTGTAAPGAAVTLHPTVAGGMTTLTAWAANATGEGPKDRVQMWIGPDQPNNVSGVTLAIADSVNATLSWTEPGSTGRHAGYVDTQALTYDITRYPDGATVATGVKGNTYTGLTGWTGTLTPFWYTVTANYSGQKASPVESNCVTVGDQIIPPYRQVWEHANQFKTWTVLNYDSDDFAWAYNASTRTIDFNVTQTKQSNDYLLSPPIKMQAGTAYRIRLNYSAVGANKEIQVTLGTSAMPAFFTDTLLARSTLPLSNSRLMDVIYIPKTDGRYRVAVRSYGGASGTLRLGEFDVDEVGNQHAPAASANLTATPTYKGRQGSVGLSFTLPVNDLTGNALSQITSVEIARNGAVAATLGAANPGATLQWTDTAPADGQDNTYTVTAINSAGRGLPASVKQYVGIDIPQAPQQVTLVNQGGDNLQVSWQAPVTRGASGGLVVPDELTYSLYQLDANSGRNALLQSGLRALSANVAGERMDYGNERVLVYGTSAKSQRGEGAVAYSNALVAGAAQNLPFNESFANQSLHSFGFLSVVGNPYVGLSSTSIDGDGGGLAWWPNGQGDEVWYNTGKLRLQGTYKPTLTFWQSVMARMGLNLDVIAVTGDSQDQETLLASYKGSDHTINGWYERRVDLTPVKNQPWVIVRLRFYGYDANNASGVDQLVLRDVLPRNLAVSLTAPGNVNAGSDYQATATVTNVGSLSASGYVVALYNGDQLVDTIPAAVSLAPDSTQQYVFDCKASALAKSANLRAEVQWTRDMDKHNNLSQTSVNIEQSEYAGVTDLEAKFQGKNSVQLNWSAPQPGKVAHHEDFESYNDFAVDTIAPWTTVDGDKGRAFTVFGFGDEVDILQHPRPYAWMVFNPAAAGVAINVDGQSFEPHSGNKCLMSLEVDTATTQLRRNDDWLISPVLDGDAQRMSLWVKTTMDYYGLEDYQVLYSTREEADTAQFQPLYQSLAKDEWERIELALPQGTRRFAIRNMSSLKWMLMVDDITYYSGDLQVTGYDLYRDGELVGTVPADTLAWTDAGVSATTHRYQLVARYGDNGNSRLSNTATAVPLSGINDVAASEIAIAGGTGTVTITGAQGQPVQVFDLRGAALHSLTAPTDQITLNVPAGAVVVRAGAIVKKVLVK